MRRMRTMMGMAGLLGAAAVLALGLHSASRFIEGTAPGGRTPALAKGRSDDHRASKGGGVPRADAQLAPLGRNCLSLDEIGERRILSDRDILLRLADGTTALVRLKRACPQLLYHRSFRFEGRLGQVCAELDRVLTRAGMRCTIAGFYRADSLAGGE